MVPLNPDHSSVNSSRYSAHTESSGAGHNISLDCGPTDQIIRPLSITSDHLAPETVATAVQNLDPLCTYDQFQYIHNNFNAHMVQADHETSEFALDLSPSFDFEQDGINWEYFDSGDLDRCLLGSLPFDGPNCYAGYPPLSNDRGASGVPLTGAVGANFSTANVVELSWYTRLEAGNALRVNSSEKKASAPGSPQNNREHQVEINEVYRQNLSSKLRPRWPEDPLPSTEFLVRKYPRSTLGSRLLTPRQSENVCPDVF